MKLFKYWLGPIQVLILYFAGIGSALIKQDLIDLEVSQKLLFLLLFCLSLIFENSILSMIVIPV